METGFETILASVDILNSPPDNESVEVEFLNSGLAIGRSADGDYSIFLVGPRFEPIDEQDTNFFKYGTWEAVGSVSTFPGTKIILPGSSNFPSIVALICFELIRSAAGENAAASWEACRDLVLLMIERMAESNSELLGLIGELFVLRAMLTSEGVREHYSTREVVRNWFGSGHTARDFQFSGVGIEVKTTVRKFSRHHLAGVRQSEVGHGVNGQFEDKYILVSIGLGDDTSDGEVSLSGLVSEIRQLISESQDDDTLSYFDGMLTSYGDTNTFATADDVLLEPKALRRYGVNFVRVYDMNSSSILVPRTADLSDLIHLVLGSMSFEVILPSDGECIMGEGFDGFNLALESVICR